VLNRFAVAIALPVAAFCALFALPSFANEAPPGTASKPPGIDFSPELKDPLGVPFRVMGPNGLPCEKIGPGCDQLIWTLKLASYLTLINPTPKQGGATAEDQTNVYLGFKIWGSTAPVDLSHEEHVALRKSLMRGIVGSMAIDAAACLLIDTIEACEGK
jgi:hypothetical protein